MNEIKVLSKPKNRVFKNVQNMSFEESLQYEKEFSTNEIIVPMIKNAHLVCEHTSDLWAITGERKGNKWYWSKNWINEKFVGFKQIVKGSDNGYRCRMDIHVAGDAWISEEEITGSIRMIDNENDRAIMYFVTFTDDIYSPKPKDGIYPIFNKSDLSS